MPDAFADYKGVTKSYNPTKNVPKRVEVPNKTTQLPSKRRRSTAISTNAASSKQREGKNKAPNIANATQPHVETHPMEVQPSHPTSIVHSITDVGTTERPDAIILGNNDTSQRVREISINYIESGESYDRKSTIVDIYFTEAIIEIIQNDPDPKTMAECKKRSDWNQWKDAIQAELSSLSKRKVFTHAIPTPRGIFPMEFKWVFVRKQNKNNKVVRHKARLVAQGFTQEIRH